MNSTSENIFTICGETYNKAKVVREDFLDVAGTSVAKKNNGNDSELR